MRDASVAASGTLLPWVSQKATRQYTKLNPISVATLTESVEAVVKAVEKAIGVEMLDSFGLIIDGWSHGTEHYLAVYAYYETEAGPQYPLLSLAPVIDEPDDQMNAQGHLTAITRFLPFFGKSISGCKFLVGDNCALNKRLANLLGVPLVGALEEVQQLMRKLRTLRQAAKLRTKTALVPVLRQDTRWSSTFAMLKRFFRLREFLSADDEELAAYIPSRTAHRKLAGLLESLRDVELVSKRLKDDGLTLLDARDLCDALIEIRPSFAKYLAPDADIVHSVNFEKAVVKVLAGDAMLLAEEERATLEPFKLVGSAVVPEPQAGTAEGFAERVLKRRKAF
ncbi:uncharacterized protein IUM83_12963 [Phytophthora cinnamomi]|uniref:uncharacterized protein n=1 Tax=Phytophthora cinnamomi TaxID=4785 RepID=UPI00355A8109|nr:hypothetical protein IUM83_12963 [Phytophthora cinnamomi]